jgi:hypothetical protein
MSYRNKVELFRERFEPCVLAGRSQLQNLVLGDCSFVPGAGVAQLLSELQHLTQLTRLYLGKSCMSVGGSSPPQLLPA